MEPKGRNNVFHSFISSVALVVDLILWQNCFFYDVYQTLDGTVDGSIPIFVSLVSIIELFCSFYSKGSFSASYLVGLFLTAWLPCIEIRLSHCLRNYFFMKIYLIAHILLLHYSPLLFSTTSPSPLKQLFFTHIALVFLSILSWLYFFFFFLNTHPFLLPLSTFRSFNWGPTPSQGTSVVHCNTSLVTQRRRITWRRQQHRRQQQHLSKTGI